MSIAKTVAKGSAWMLIATIIVKFSAFIYYIILARTVSQEEIGMFFLVFSIMSIVLLFSNLGLGAGAVVRYVPFYGGQGKFNYARKVLKISISAGTFFSIVCIILIILFANDLASFFHNPDFVPIFYIMAFYLLVCNFYAIARSFLQGRKLMRFVSYMTSIQGVFKVALTVILLFFIGFKAESIALGFILSFLFTAVVGWLWVLKEYGSLPESDEKPNSFLLLREMVPFGLTIGLISEMWVVNSYASRIILGYFLPPETSSSMIGIYTIVVAFSIIITTFGAAIGPIFYPLISELWGKKDINETRKITTTVIRWISLTTIPILLAILMFSKQILTTIYGPDYALGNIALILYSIGIFIFLFSRPSQWILAAMKRLDITIIVVTVGALINVLLSFIFIPQPGTIGGINGAALASAISFTIMTILFLKQSKITNVQFPKDIYKPVVAGLITVAVLFFLKPYMGEILRTLIPSLIAPADIISEIIEKVLKMAVLGVLVSTAFLIYLIFLILLKAFHKEDVEILAGAMRRAKVPKKWISITERILLR